MANKYNLYKIPEDNKLALLESLEAKGFEQTNQSENINGFQMDFYLGPQIISVPKWAILYQAFIPDPSEIRNRMPSGVLLIHNSSICYAVALGMAFHTIQKHCAKDFGLELAERIADEANLKEKASKHFQSLRSKTITSYQQNNPFSFESGESIRFIKARSINKDEWGNSVEFAISAQFNLPHDPSFLPSLIQNIESVLISEPLFVLPRTEKVTDQIKITELDSRIAQLLVSNNSASINFEDFGISGVDFVFHHSNQFSAYLKNQKSSTIRPLEELSLENLKGYVQDQGFNPILEFGNIRISAEEGDRSSSYKIRQLLDYVDDENYCLIDGDWHRFNRSYITYLETIVDSIDWEHLSEYDFPSGSIEDNLLSRCVYDGYYSFHGKQHSSQFENKMTRYKVEKMDLYNDRTMFFVKKGGPQKLNYVIDQAINTVRLLQSLSTGINIGGSYIKIKRVCVWIMVPRVTDIQNLSDFNSLIFLMKLADFKRVVQDAGFQPLVRVNYIRS